MPPMARGRRTVSAPRTARGSSLLTELLHEPEIGWRYLSFLHWTGLIEPAQTEPEEDCADT
jgi:hypothetical protein